MKQREPVALWKGIVGTALSGSLLMILTPVFFIYTSRPEKKELWLEVTLVASILICIFSLIISLINLVSTTSYKKTQRANSNYPQTDKFDEIRKYKELLDEGIISQEEFEDKKKKLLD